jgi:aryl-alcohol dehydrogenase-like predicted oxidoreductase
MEKRRLGKTGQMSTLITFGSAALWKVSQAEADAAIELALEHGVNHFDVAPTYGQAELRLGPWMEKHHKEVFLACKTIKRGKAQAWESLKRSLETLRVDSFDLFQFHGVSSLDALNVILGERGALEAILEAKQQGLVRHIGITGHSPLVLVEALHRFDFETVLFPLNRVLAAHANDHNDFLPLLEVVRAKDVGTICIKSVAKRPWEGPMHMYRTWYEPFDEQAEIDKSLWYALSYGVTTAALPADVRLWPMVLDAAERFRPLHAHEMKEALAEVEQFKPLFPRAQPLH